MMYYFSNNYDYHKKEYQYITAVMNYTKHDL